MIPTLPKNYFSEQEVISMFFSGECALIRIKELKRLQDIENKYDSICHIISMKEPKDRGCTMSN